jgi:hypothetical protein
VALVFVLLADRRLEGLLLVLAPAALGLDAVAAHGGSTLAACSPPITEMRLLGHIHRKRGL